MAELAREGAAGFSDDGVPGRGRPAHAPGAPVPAAGRRRARPARGGPGPLRQRASCTRARSRRCSASAGIPSISESTMIERDAAARPLRGGARSTSCTCPPPSRSTPSSGRGTRASQITAEVTPHHLVLTDEAVRSLDSRFKMNPPLRVAARPRGADRGPALGRDRLRRDRPRSPLAGGEGGAVRGGADGRDRPRDRLRGPLYGPRAARRARPRPAGGAHDRRRRARTACGLRRSRRARRADLCLVDLEARWTVGEAGYECRSDNSCFAGRELQGRVLMTLRGGAVAYRERGFAIRLADDRPGRSRPGARVKLDRSRAALVVVDVQEAFRPAVLDFEQVARQRGGAGAGRARAGAADARHRAVPEGPRAHGARGGRAPRRDVSRSRRSPSARSRRTASRRAARGAPRPGPAVRDRGPRVREPDGRGPARGRRRGARRRRTPSPRARRRTARSACTRWSAPARS